MRRGDGEIKTEDEAERREENGGEEEVIKEL